MKRKRRQPPPAPVIAPESVSEPEALALDFAGFTDEQRIHYVAALMDYRHRESDQKKLAPPEVVKTLGLAQLILARRGVAVARAWDIPS